MPVPTHPRSHTRVASDKIEIRLPWWSVALPAVAFAALLLLMTGSTEARAAASAPAVGRILEQIHLTLVG
ncbi:MULTISPECIES: hypothetical protein [unclassified Streptomyces]|uniref:hypothetical protein n=1 Tax=unclassified Streptomyces TaxID=2593676 RepID=UPI00081F58EA|nr:MULTISPECIES: hypothetical protein [unclassified Streptomyces]MYZ39770.1 hypothetical protein [Streptomyces sp. SID4917]SCG05174.1 hypothetical protein GA0115259_109355 [Streptomyces sp. MnatMP-M17]